MTLDEITKLIDEKDESLHKFVKECRENHINFYKTKQWKDGCKELRELEKQYTQLARQKEFEDGLLYDDEEWITKKFYTSEKSLADARLGLAKLLSKLNGVSVKEKKGVQLIEVKTKWKIYYYTIHAHYGIEVLETETRPSLSLFKTDRTIEVITKSKTIYQAWLDFNSCIRR